MIKSTPMYLLIEGPDGSGKTTVCTSLTEILQKRGYNVVRIREPGSTPLAEDIRNIVLHSDHHIGSMSELLMLLAARASTMELVAKAMTVPNTIVIADRGYPSTYAYQVIDKETASVYESTWKLLAPARRLTTLLTCSYETSCARRARRSLETDNIEQRLTESAFTELLGRYKSVPGGYDVVLDTNDMTVSDVVRGILNHICD
ncbi:thymidylate kinase [Yersinia phage fHe-Yen9-02]|nr:thymidylate kinase [Yersinia phage fHe-Yen9-02]